MTTTSKNASRINYVHSRRIADLSERFRLSSGLPPKKPRKPRSDTLPGRMRALAAAGPGGSVLCADSLPAGPVFVTALTKKAEEAYPGMVVTARMDAECRVVLHWPVGEAPAYQSRFGWETLAVGQSRIFTDDQMPEKPNRLRGRRWLMVDAELWRRAKPEARKHAMIVIDDHGTHYSAYRAT